MSALLLSPLLKLIHIHRTVCDGADVLGKPAYGVGYLRLGHFQDSLTSHQVVEEGSNSFKILPETLL